MQESESPAPRAKDRDDEIDLVELLGFVMRIRKPLLLGMVAGSVLGAAWVFGFQRPLYESSVSVTIDPTSLPAINDPKRIVEAYQDALGSPDLAAVAFRRIVESSKPFADAMAARGLALGDLVNSQTQGEERAPRPLRVAHQNSSQDFVLETSFPVAGLGDEAARLLVQGLNDAANEHNARAVSLNQEAAKNLVRQATRAVEEAEASAANVQSQHEAELTRIRSDLARLEYRLIRKAGNSSDLLRFIDSPREPQTLRLITGVEQSGPLEKPVATLELDRVLRLASALEEEKRLSEKEADDVRADLVKLQLGFHRNESLYSSVISANGAVMRTLYDSMSKAVVPLARAEAFLPLFKLNEQLYRENPAARSFEVPARRRIAIIAVAALAGLLAGGFIGALREFLARNGAKFRELTREGN
jgi:hypothetical protein